jgi:CheY-like chemotaxis protein
MSIGQGLFTEPVDRRAHDDGKWLTEADRLATCPVLIVDDDPSLLETVSAILADEGYRIATATNGLEALNLLAYQEPLPRVVLLDMRMPVMNGWDFAREIQRQGIPLRLIVMTAAQDATAWASEIEAEGVLPKPFELEQVLTEVERCCAA